MNDASRLIDIGLVPAHLADVQIYKAGKPHDELARERNVGKISKLASNENPLGPSPFAIKEMTNALWSTHRYPDMHAFKLKNALMGLYNLKLENIIIGNGSEGIMGYIARAFLRPGLEVLTSENTFIGFYILAKSAGATLKKVPLTKEYKFDVKALVNAITDKTKIIYVANPNNPTGTYMTKSEFQYLKDNVPDHILIILDEAYYEFARDIDDYPDSMDYRYDNVITLRTFSKAYGLGGIRVGYGFAHEDFISYLTKVKLPFEPSLIGQVGAVGALHDIPHLERTLTNNEEQYNLIFEYLLSNDFNPIPSITNFITFKTGSTKASDWMFDKLLDEGVIIRPLKANEMDDYVRVSLGTPEQTQHYIKAMDKILPEYNNLFGRPS